MASYSIDYVSLKDSLQKVQQLKRNVIQQYHIVANNVKDSE